MNKALFTLTLAVLAFSAPLNTAAFDLPALRPVNFAEVKTPEVPSPAPALKGPACRPFLLETAVGGVAETVAVMRACTPDNAPVWILMVGLRGKPGIQAKVDSSKYPDRKAAMEKRIMGAAIEGVSQADADFIVNRTGPLLARAAAASGPEREALLAQATEELAARLARL